MAAIATSRPGRLAVRALDAFRRPLVTVGSHVVFYGQVLYRLVFVIGRGKHRQVVAQQVSDVVIGSGAYVLGGGMVFVIITLSLAAGGVVGLQSVNALDAIGAQSFIGLVSAYINVRETTPIIAGTALAAQLGASFTAELGAQRISEEIDALEVMSVEPISYLVATRLAASLIAIVPLYLISLFAAFFATKLVSTQLLDLSPGVYDYYFNLFLPPIDVLGSLVKVVVFTVLVVLIHCYYGFNATGGPAGVGVAVGRAIRASLTAIIVVNLFLSQLFYGGGGGASLTG